MSEEEPFFICRNGAVWACWLGSRPAVKIGAEADVLAAMKQFLAEVSGYRSEREPVATVTSSTVPPPLSPAPERQLRDEKERFEARHEIVIVGRVRSGIGARDVTVLDLSERGCRFHDRLGHLADGTPLTIKVGPIGPIAARVRWREGEYVGIEFDDPLYPSVLEHIREHFDLRR